MHFHGSYHFAAAPLQEGLRPLREYRGSRPHHPSPFKPAQEGGSEAIDPSGHEEEASSPFQLTLLEEEAES